VSHDVERQKKEEEERLEEVENEDEGDAWRR
jgi:hypothetical protein